MAREAGQFLLTCTTGFEEISAAEAEELGAHPVELREGRVIVEGGARLMYRLNAWARTIHRVLLLVGRFRVEDLRDVRDAGSGIDCGIIGHGRTFAVRSERSGVHPFTSMDVASTVGSAVLAACSGTRVDLEDPDVIIRADVVGPELFLSIDTTGESLHIREWRRFNHPSSIKPSLASALIRLSGWRGDSLLDAFAGGATIPIEAALRWMGRRVHERRDYAYRRLPMYDPAAEEEERGSDPSPLPVPPRAGEIVGVEVKPKYYEGALKNLDASGTSGIVRMILGDSLRWRPERRFRFVVTNPPYGVRSGGRKRVAGLYRRFASRLPEILEPGGIAVAVTTEHRQMAEALSSAGLRVLEVRKGRHGRLWGGAVKGALV